MATRFGDVALWYFLDSADERGRSVRRFYSCAGFGRLGKS